MFREKCDNGGGTMSSYIFLREMIVIFRLLALSCFNGICVWYTFFGEEEGEGGGKGILCCSLAAATMNAMLAQTFDKNYLLTSK